MSGVLNAMPNLTGTMDRVKGLLFNKKFLIIMVIVVIFLAVAFYVYNTYIAPRINPDFVPNREFDDGDAKDATLYFFRGLECSRAVALQANNRTTACFWQIAKLLYSFLFKNYLILELSEGLL